MSHEPGTSFSHADKAQMEFEVARRAALYAYERYLVARARLKAAAEAAGVEFKEGDLPHAMAGATTRPGQQA